MRRIRRSCISPDHEDPEMAKAVREGRKREFAAFGFAEEEVPDPEARETFERSKLEWRGGGRGRAQEMLEWYRALIRMRRRSEALNDGDMGHIRVRWSDDWLVMDRGAVQVLVNLGQQEARFAVPEGFRVELVSRDGVGTVAGMVVLPADTLAVLSNETE